MGNCQDGKPCLTHDLWYGLNVKIHEYLNGVNLQQLVDGQLKNDPQISTIALTRSARVPALMPA
jgi:Rrf2 family iron-sulfur cluster assembly transcriptional regulator